jgi:hypothetical protein
MKPVKVVNDKGTEFWYQNYRLHREDGPALLRSDGSEYWCKNGEMHRNDGPAVIRSNNRHDWWLNNKRYDSFEEWLKDTDADEQTKLMLILKWSS